MLRDFFSEDMQKGVLFASLLPTSVDDLKNREMQTLASIDPECLFVIRKNEIPFDVCL